MTSHLFTPLTLRGITLRNRIGVSPMAQYSCLNGLVNMWHAVHLGCRAVGGAGLVMSEATAVSAMGRISVADPGIWNDAQAEAFRSIANFIKAQGAVPGIQLAHAGRKGSTHIPWVARGAIAPEEGGWQPIAPSALKFADNYAQPREMTEADMEVVIAEFVSATRRSVQAGFEVVELHMAHGYLLHQFLSPLTNHRTDEYGETPENRARLPLRVAQAVRAAWPANLPLFARLSVTDWLSGGLDVAASVQLSVWLREAGVDLIDCSSGAIAPGSESAPTPGFQVPFAAAVRKGAAVATAAVGMITEYEQADQILREGSADMVMLAKVLLEDPYWPLRAAWKLEQQDGWPPQYTRAVRRSVRGV